MKNESLKFRVLRVDDLNRICDFAESLSGLSPEDPIEKRFKQWRSSGRDESMRFYLEAGWSFEAYQNAGNSEVIQGFLLAQPLLYFRTNTQSLWVELVQAATQEVAAELTSVAFGVAREKHFQRVLLFKQGHTNFVQPDVPLPGQNYLDFVEYNISKEINTKGNNK